jgi:lipoate-protein ligase A
VGSAQARSRGVFLEHGSILLDNDQPRILDFLPKDVPLAMRSLLRDHLTCGIASLREFRPGLSIRELDDALELAYSRELGVELVTVPFGELPSERLMELEKECRIGN